MTISNRLNRTTLLGNGVSTTIPIEFPFHSVDDLVVIETILATGAQTIKAMTTHYTVTGAQDALGHYPTGGSVVMVSAPASTVSITVYRDVAALQQVILVENEKIPVKASIESPLDRLTMIAQRLIDRADRTMAQPDGDSANIGTLPAKVVRASRYLGFDGDGNPTMMQTPTGQVTSIAQLTESTYAGLPAAGSAGLLRKVTSGLRGVWMDTGAQWLALNGSWANVRDFGAVGDGVTNDTSAVQAAITAATGGVWFPPGNYLCGNLEISGKSKLVIAGIGATITWTGTAGAGEFIGFEFLGTCSHVTIRDLVFVGDGVIANGHAAVWNTSGQTLSDIAVVYTKISNCVVGISYNANLSGTFTGGVIAYNELDTIVGPDPGQGYGIHLAKATKIRVFDNSINKAQRHAIYHAAGDTGCVIHHNVITNHRQGVATAAYRPAIVVSRSTNVIVTDNIVRDHYDGGIEISHVTTDSLSCSTVLVEGNIFANRQNAIQDIFIGEQAVPGTYETLNVTIRNNQCVNAYATSGTSGAIIVLNGRRISIRGNVFLTTGITSTARFIEIGHNSYITNDADCEDTLVEDNEFYAEGSSLTDLRVIDYCGDICTNTSRHVARRNTTLTSANLHYFDSTQTNPNLICAGSTGHVMGIYTAGDTTPSVRGVTCLYITNAGAVSITTFDDGEEAQLLSLIFGDANTTIVDGATVQLASGSNFTSAGNKTLQLVKRSTVWTQIGGSTN